MYNHFSQWHYRPCPVSSVIKASHAQLIKIIDKRSQSDTGSVPQQSPQQNSNETNS